MEEEDEQKKDGCNLLFGKLSNPLSMNIQSVQKKEGKKEDDLVDSGKSPNHASNSKLSQNFISEINEKDFLKVDKMSNFHKIKQKNSLFENSSLDRIKQEGEWRLNSRGNDKENETLSYNLSGTLQSKKRETIGKRGQIKFRNNNNDLLKLQTKGCSSRQLVFKICSFFKQNLKNIFLENVLDFETLEVHVLLKGCSRKEKLSFLFKTFNLIRKKKRTFKITHILLRILNRLKTEDKMQNQVLIKEKIPLLDKLVKRDFSSKKISKSKKYLNSYKKKVETITTKEILTWQSTNKLNSQKKDSYMFNTSYKTNQKKKRDSKKNTLVMSHVHREKQSGSVLTYSDVNKTNFSNQLRKDSEQGSRYNKEESIGRMHHTKRRQKFTGKKESNLLKQKKNKRPPIRSVSSVMKLTRDMVFNTQQAHLKSIKNPKIKKHENKNKSNKEEAKEIVKESPTNKRESETDRVRQKKMQLNGLEFDTQKSLISNFWNDKLTKRQSLQKSKLKGSSAKVVKDPKQNKKQTQFKWKRKTVKSLRDKGLELRMGTPGESLLSSKQETSLMKGSMRRVSITGMALLKNKSPNKISTKTSALKIKKLRKKLMGAGNKDTSRLKINKSIKMNLKGNFRKMKSISPPSNWSISRFNKMKNNFFKKKKGDNRKPLLGHKTEVSQPSENSKSQTLSGKKKMVNEKESPQEIGSSSNFYCHNPYSNINEKPRISRVLARPRESLDNSLNENNFNENPNNFFKKTLPEISEGETNESSEHTIVMSSKKKSNGKEDVKNEEMETKVNTFKTKDESKKEERRRRKNKNDVIHKNSFGVNMKSSLNKANLKQINRKSPLGKRLIMQNRPRQPSRSTNELKHFMKEPCTSEEFSNSSRNQNLKKNFEELSKQMKTNSDRFYLGNPRAHEKNEDTRFKILNAKRSIKQKSKVDGSRLTDNGREVMESHDTETLQSDAIKTSPNNLLKYRKRQKMKKNMEQKENRSPDLREKYQIDGVTMLTPEPGKNVFLRKDNNSLKKETVEASKARHFEQNRSLDKAKFYLPRNLKAFKSTKMNLVHFEKHKFNQQKTFHTRSELKKVPFNQKKKRMQVNGSQDSFKTQDLIQKRFKPGKGSRVKPGLMIIKKKINSKNSLLKAKSFDKSRLLKDNTFGVFTFGK
jgi:hypothetical protein